MILIILAFIILYFAYIYFNKQQYIDVSCEHKIVDNINNDYCPQINWLVNKLL